MYLCSVKRKLIYHHVLNLNKSAQEIYVALFEDSEQISFAYLVELVRKIRASPEEMYLWSVSSPFFAGRTRMLNETERRFIHQLSAEDNGRRITQIHRRMRDEYGEGHNCPSYATVRRTLIRAGLSRKVMVRRSILINHEHRIHHIVRFNLLTSMKWLRVVTLRKNMDGHR